MNKRLLTSILMIVLLMVAGITHAQTGSQDTDGDGLPDNSDNCPLEAGPRENGGCPRVRPTQVRPDTSTTPVESTPEPTVEQPIQSTISLIPMPSDGRCVVSPSGVFNVNIREYPTKFSQAIGVLAVNEMAPVLDVATIFFYAEPERVETHDSLGWYKIDHKNTIGWVAHDVVRFGGDCSDFVMPTMVGADEILAPDTGGLKAAFIKFDGIKVNSDTAANEDGHKEWINLISMSAQGEDVLIHPYRGAEKADGVAIDPLKGRVLVNGAGRPLVEIIPVNDAGAAGSTIPTHELDILVCANIADPNSPLSEDDCVVITTAAARAKADILIEANVLLCVANAGGLLTCGGAQANTTGNGGDCVHIGRSSFCATDYLPSDSCFIDPDDGHLICTGYPFISVSPFNPQSDLPALALLNPDGHPPQMALLLPAVQKIRAAR